MKHLNLFAVGFAAFFAATPLQSKVYYVTTNGTNDGTSWKKAMGSLDDALAKATSGDEIWIAAGTYKPTQLIKTSKKNSRHFPLKNGVSIYGGFAGTEKNKEERMKVEDGEAYDYVNTTILSADDDVPDEWIRETNAENPYMFGWKVDNNIIPGTANNANHILYTKEEITAPVTIDGLTLKGANAMVYNVQCSGGAIYAVGDVTITNCRFIENSCYFTAEGDKYANGAAIYLIGKNNAKISGCYFERTYGHSPNTQAQGGAVYAENVDINDCFFLDCVALDAGGAIYNVGGTITDCLFEGCYAREGGAIYSTGLLRDNEIISSRGLIGGGIYNLGTAINNVVTNCFADYTLLGDDKGGAGGGVYNKGTFVGGLVYNCTSFNGGGIYTDGGKIINSTIQNNKTRKATTNANLDYSSNCNVATDIVNTINSNTVDKANFVAPTNFDGFTTNKDSIADILFASWELQMGSEFVDKGMPISIENYTEDIYGNNRIMGKSIDVGAAEFNPATFITPIKPESEGVKQNYYTLDGRYIGNTRPALPGIYVVQTVNKGKLLTVKKIFIK
ncbi:right-handed parallel beta-helix repeat-containing protein [Prevotella pallens]|uniref:right-handed parallel beta-helix repeat-containing protein n=1 Tax=Prevotella pallens TaxID=60133 RepID=UPI001CAF7B34|nr:right-handed parallel beta-helix repeat-containing protein [Prevotella pallens]MBF1516540.1 right-handed parallel beta-helix repeat-containing protein [Prevotella pallens]